MFSNTGCDWLCRALAACSRRLGGSDGLAGMWFLASAAAYARTSAPARASIWSAPLLFFPGLPEKFVGPCGPGPPASEIAATQLNRLALAPGRNSRCAVVDDAGLTHSEQFSSSCGSRLCGLASAQRRPVVILRFALGCLLSADDDRRCLACRRLLSLRDPRVCQKPGPLRASARPGQKARSGCPLAETLETRRPRGSCDDPVAAGALESEAAAGFGAAGFDVSLESAAAAHRHRRAADPHWHVLRLCAVSSEPPLPFGKIGSRPHPRMRASRFLLCNAPITVNSPCESPACSAS